MHPNNIKSPTITNMSYSGADRFSRTDLGSLGPFNQEGDPNNRFSSTMKGFTHLGFERSPNGELRLTSNGPAPVSEKEMLTSLKHENNGLKVSNDKMQMNIGELNKKILELRTMPSTIKICPNPENDIKVGRLEAENNRLRAQLEQKAE